MRPDDGPNADRQILARLMALADVRQLNALLLLTPTFQPFEVEGRYPIAAARSEEFIQVQQ